MANNNDLKVPQIASSKQIATCDNSEYIQCFTIYRIILAVLLRLRFHHLMLLFRSGLAEHLNANTYYKWTVWSALLDILYYYIHILTSTAGTFLKFRCTKFVCT